MNQSNLSPWDYLRCTTAAVAAPTPSPWMVIAMIITGWLLWITVIATIAKLMEYIFDELLPQNSDA